MSHGVENAPWDRFLSHVRTVIGEDEYTLWVQPLELAGSNGSHFVAHVPNRFFEKWLHDNYRSLFQRAQEEVGITVEFRLGGDKKKRTRIKGPEQTLSARSAHEPGTELHPDLNARYTFETFVPGSSNQFAHASGLAVAERPGHRYNPLFIYGGVGLGKTHLLHAIGHAQHARNRNDRVMYLSAEQFMNEVVNAIRFDKIAELRQRFRNQCDLLLIDDVQFIAGKDRTQDEFFHIFNSLYERGKQIVFTSDKVPREIPALEERLRSRFESGLIADIQPPEFEHRLAILQRKAADLGLQMPSEVMQFVATYIHSNVRELEGALTRLSAKASFEGREIDLEFTRRVLSDLIDFVGPGVSVDRIQNVVAELYQIRPVDLRGRSRKKVISFPRQVAMHLCRELTNLSLPDIGQRFGGKDHSTVLHSIRKIENLRRSDPELDSLLTNLQRTLNRGG